MNSLHSAHLAVFNDNNQILLVKRRDVPVWVIPGGRGEKGESPMQTALREFSEETGVKVSSSNVCLVAKYISDNNNHRIKYLFTTSRKRINGLTLTEESSDYGFFNIDKLPHVISLYEQRKIHEAFIKNAGSALVRKDEVLYISEIVALLREPTKLIRLLYFFFRARKS